MQPMVCTACEEAYEHHNNPLFYLSAAKFATKTSCFYMPADPSQLAGGFSDEKVDEHPVPKGSKRLLKVHPSLARKSAVVEEHVKECGALDEHDEEDVTLSPEEQGGCFA